MAFRGIFIKAIKLMLIVLALGIFAAVGSAQPHESGKHHGGGHQYDWIGAGGVTHYSYPSYYTYPSYYYNSWYYPTYTYPGRYYNYYNYYNYYPYQYPYYENVVEMRPGETKAEWLFYHGIGEQWIGGNPPHSQWWH